MFRLIPALLMIVATAHALCGRPQPRRLDAEVFGAQLIVTARLVATDEVASRDEQDYRRYHLDVLDTLRGAARRSVVVLEQNDSSRAGFAWVKGESYLLLLKPTFGRQTSFSLDGCGASGLFVKRAKAIQEITKILAAARGAKSGILQGEVFTQVAPEDIHVELQAPGYRTTLGVTKSRTFAVRLPKGCYQIKAFSGRTTFREHLLSYGTTQPACVPGGGAYQVAFGD